ncbi:MAG TPA: Spy/CpxP family protein refolding chaperone [Thermoanaerobaculia bacterium]|nr:Spy/CpxP family protein refolding chaperone [Thermoanaerobaculia bacterium]
MKRTLIAALILIVAVAAIAAPPQRPGRAGGGAGGPGGPAEGGLPPQLLARFLDLSEAQITQAQALRETLQTTVEPLREQTRANHEEIEAALAAGDSAKAGQLMLANYNLRAQIKAAHDSYKASFEAMLTAEQKAKFAVYQELVELRREGRGPRD